MIPSMLGGGERVIWKFVSCYVNIKEKKSDKFNEQIPQKSNHFVNEELMHVTSVSQTDIGFIHFHNLHHPQS